MVDKIGIIGAGNVGATTAHLCSIRELGDIILVDIIEGLPQGRALDISEALPIEESDTDITGTTDYRDVSDSDLIVVTAGIARKPGIAREDLLRTNTKIMRDVSAKIREYSPNSIVIIVSNPLDAMVYVASETIKCERKRIMGMAGVLDSARMTRFIADELKISPSNIDSLVLGGHGDTMVPLPRYTTVSGIGINNLLSKKRVDEIVERTRSGGAEIVKLLKTGSAYYAPASAITYMVKSILKDEMKVMPVAAYLNGEYGVKGLFIGVPAILGRSGVEKIIEIELDDAERIQFEKTVKHTQKLIESIPCREATK